ncbi:acyloxyacyl hydrolase [Leptolyngbya sp. FACHB-16]|nr:acyloxyacyl hydrolase [Leptolyngbya sp. FACHB-8]MBD2154849.1 acyloxyacyl hydrolase [Leptolyngbya sp. FACHB-16]
MATIPIVAEAASPESTELAQNNSSEPIPAYGQQGSQRWYVQGGAASNLDSDETRNFGLVGAGISHFFLDGNSINFELNGMAFNQPGDDALGLNLAAILRWDFIRQQNWSLYIDGGAGLIGTTDSVPSDGTRYNFTPQAGGGATIRLNERNRLMVGIRWHHISNADTSDSNPGQDLIFGYVGVNFPR